MSSIRSSKSRRKASLLDEQRAHNDRAWFHVSERRYEAEVRGPIPAFMERLPEVSPHFVEHLKRNEFVG